MGMPEMILEHRKGEKVQKYLRVQPNRTMFVIGASREADLRIVGEGVQGCHAVLRYRDPHWYICDVSGTESVKVNGQIVAEALVDATAKVEIAGNRIQLFTREVDKTLFKDGETSKDLSLHQVVVMRKGRVVETRVLGARESYTFLDGETKALLPAPTTGEWVETVKGARVVRQRLVGAQEILKGEEIRIDGAMKKPVMIAAGIFMLLAMMLVLLTPKKNEMTEVALDKKSLDIIYNAQTIKKKKEEAKKVVKAAKGKSGGTTETAVASKARTSLPEESQAPKVSAKTTQALTSLRNSGISNLIGKIAKRASKQGVMVAAVGVNPDTAGSGRAFFSTGTSTVGGGGSASKEGPTFKLGGVATKGKAGGVGNFKDGTALAGGSVGTGNVVALVDDEETSIEGGLDKDAIAEVIRRNIGQIRYCYERQLSSNPELYGKVLVRFTIGAAGQVAEQRVDNTTLKSAMVEGCILRRLAGWKFPLPKGGTEVRVSYPFLFKALD